MNPTPQVGRRTAQSGWLRTDEAGISWVPPQSVYARAMFPRHLPAPRPLSKHAELRDWPRVALAGASAG